LWGSFDSCWAGWQQIARCEVDANHGLEEPAGIKPSIARGPLKQAVARDRKKAQLEAEAWFWLIRRFQEAMAASQRKAIPPYANGWIGWRSAVFHHINSMKKREQMSQPMWCHIPLLLPLSYPHGDPEVPALLKVLQTKYKHVVLSSRKVQREAWQTKLQEGVSKGTGWAHRITKLSAAPTLNFNTPTGACDIPVPP
jgi:hypothetical protein